jgi:hypothetical protein
MPPIGSSHPFAYRYQAGIAHELGHSPDDSDGMLLTALP